MNIKRMAPLAALACLALVACDAGSVPIDELAEEIGQVSFPTPSAVPRPTRTPVPTLDASISTAATRDGTADCVTAAFEAIDCDFGLERDVTEIVLDSDGQTLTITITIEGEAWGAAPDHFATFLFDTDMNSATGSRTLGIQHGIGPEINIFAGWTESGALPFGIELYDEVGSRIDVLAERDDVLTILDDQTLQLELDLEIIGSETFNFVFSLQSAVRLDVFDNVPERGESITFQ